MLVSVSLMPPVTSTSPLGRIDTPGQNMLCAVLLIVAAVTAPVLRSRIAVCVYGDVSEPKLRSSSADHTTSLLPGMRAAAAGTSGKPIVGPHWPTTDGPGNGLAPAPIVGGAWPPADRSADAGGAVTLGAPAVAPGRAPVSTIFAAATERARIGETDNAVNRTARTARGIHATFLSVAFACQRPYATVRPNLLPSCDRVTRNRPISPSRLRGTYVR